MKPIRHRLSRVRAAGLAISRAALVLGVILSSTPASAQDTALRDPAGDRAATLQGSVGTRDTTLRGPPGARDTTLAERLGPVRIERFRTPPATFAAPASLPVGEEEPRSAWAVAGAAVAGGALGWAVGATAGLLATHDRFAQDDLSPLLYAAIGGVAVSVPAAAVSAHWASRGRGSILTSTLLGYAVAGVTILAWPDGGWVLGPALAIPIAVVVEAP